MTYTEFNLYCKALCLLYKCSESSGIRTKYRNTLVGGAERSTHQTDYGFGKDLVPDVNSSENKAAISWAAETLGMSFVLIEDDHVHVGYRIKG